MKSKLISVLSSRSPCLVAGAALAITSIASQASAFQHGSSAYQEPRLCGRPAAAGDGGMQVNEEHLTYEKFVQAVEFFNADFPAELDATTDILAEIARPDLVGQPYLTGEIAVSYYNNLIAIQGYGLRQAAIAASAMLSASSVNSVDYEGNKNSLLIPVATLREIADKKVEDFCKFVTASQWDE